MKLVLMKAVLLEGEMTPCNYVTDTEFEINCMHS